MTNPQCSDDNGFDGRIGLRISSIFVIFIGAFLGCWLPVYISRHKRIGAPGWMWAFAKYFGSGVIIATAFIHLLAPANEALSNPCLDGTLPEYPWVECICLISIFALFVAELLMTRFVRSARRAGKSDRDFENEGNRERDRERDRLNSDACAGRVESQYRDDPSLPPSPGIGEAHRSSRERAHDQVGTDASSATLAEYDDNGEDAVPVDGSIPLHGESNASQITAVLILEFGVIFHSVFIGLTLAVAGPEFLTLFIVLTLHQTFEGLAIGSRLATINWQGRRSTPYYMAIGYALSTPIAIAVGLAVRSSIHPHSKTSLIVNGIFDSVSAGILIYTGLVELMANDFVLNERMQLAPRKEVWSAVVFMALGATLMAILGIWA